MPVILVRMEQLVLITMVAVDTSVSVLLALREPTVKMVHYFFIFFYSILTIILLVTKEGKMPNMYTYFLSDLLLLFLLDVITSDMLLSCIIMPVVYYGYISFCMHFLFTEILACASNPCQNDATCFDNNGGSGYVCLCPAGFEGTTCENGTYYFSFPWHFSKWQ